MSVLGLLCAIAILLIALNDLRDNKVPFGRNFISFSTQVVVLIWLVLSQLQIVILTFNR